MAMNLVHFQEGLSISDLLGRYGNEATCRRALYCACWPKDFRRPDCADRRRSTFRRDRQVIYQCRAYSHQTTLLADTLFLAIHLLSITQTNMAVLELMRHLGVCYRPLWLKHKIMQAMLEREEPRRLEALVQIDDAYLEGER